MLFRRCRGTTRCSPPRWRRRRAEVAQEEPRRAGPRCPGEVGDAHAEREAARLDADAVERELREEGHPLLGPVVGRDVLARGGQLVREVDAHAVARVRRRALDVVAAPRRDPARARQVAERATVGVAEGPALYRVRRRGQVDEDAGDPRAPLGELGRGPRVVGLGDAEPREEQLPRGAAHGARGGVGRVAAGAVVAPACRTVLSSRRPDAPALATLASTPPRSETAPPERSEKAPTLTALTRCVASAHPGCWGMPPRGPRRGGTRRRPWSGRRAGRSMRALPRGRRRRGGAWRRGRRRR